MKILKIKKTGRPVCQECFEGWNSDIGCGTDIWRDCGRPYCSFSRRYNGATVEEAREAAALDAAAEEARAAARLAAWEADPGPWGAAACQRREAAAAAAEAERPLREEADRLGISFKEMLRRKAQAAAARARR